MTLPCVHPSSCIGHALQDPGPAQLGDMPRSQARDWTMSTASSPLMAGPAPADGGVRRGNPLLSAGAGIIKRVSSLSAVAGS